MWLKLLLIILMMYLVFPFASAKENITIEEIGTEPKELIDSTYAWFFANLSNSGDTQVEIVLEFKLDSTSVEKKKAILEPKTYQKQIKSDNSSSVSPSNKMIEAIVYVNETIVNKSAQITVNKRESPPEQGKNNFVFGYLLIAIAIGIFIGIYLFVKTRKTVREEKIGIGKAEISSQEAVKQPASGAYQNIMTNLSNDFAFFLSDLKNQPEGYRLIDESKLLIDIIKNINDMMQNINKNNTEGAKQSFENVKQETHSLISRFKGAQIDAISHRKVVIPHDVTTHETFDKNKIKAELEKKRAETNSKKQFVDVLIPEFLLKIAEEKMHDGNIKAAEGLISASEKMLENDEVLQRLRKLREIGF